MARAAASPLWRRLDIAARTFVATVGGYVAAALATACFARLLPIARDQAVITGMLSSFAIFCAIVIWAYSDTSTRRVAIGVALILAALGGLLWYSYAPDALP